MPSALPVVLTLCAPGWFARRSGRRPRGLKDTFVPVAVPWIVSANAVAVNKVGANDKSNLASSISVLDVRTT